MKSVFLLCEKQVPVGLNQASVPGKFRLQLTRFGTLDTLYFIIEKPQRTILESEKGVSL
jgi:hypothetical protein